MARYKFIYLFIDWWFTPCLGSTKSNAPPPNCYRQDSVKAKCRRACCGQKCPRTKAL